MLSSSRLSSRWGPSARGRSGLWSRARLRSSMSRGYVGRGWRGGGLAVVAGSRRRGGGGGRGAVVEVLQVQFIDKVVDVLMQLKFQQSGVCTGSSSTECWTFQLCSERTRTVQTVQEDCSWCRRSCDQQRQVLAVQRFESFAPDSVHPQSGEHSCCAAEFRRNSTGAVLGGC